MPSAHVTGRGDLKISYRERLLGLYIGTKATIADQYMDPMKKFDTLLPKLRAEAGNWSTALRIVAVNTFLYSIFGYINRHFYMPESLAAEVEGRALRLTARHRARQHGF